jgi:hypothetical protein
VVRDGGDDEKMVMHTGNMEETQYDKEMDNSSGHDNTNNKISSMRNGTDIIYFVSTM